jgi:hypothetical protein
MKRNPALLSVIPDMTCENKRLLDAQPREKAMKALERELETVRQENCRLTRDYGCREHSAQDAQNRMGMTQHTNFPHKKHQEIHTSKEAREGGQSDSWGRAPA